jgi:hypothetical protein
MFELYNGITHYFIFSIEEKILHFLKVSCRLHVLHCNIFIISVVPASPIITVLNAVSKFEIFLLFLSIRGVTPLNPYYGKIQMARPRVALCQLIGVQIQTLLRL